RCRTPRTRRRGRGAGPWRCSRRAVLPPRDERVEVIAVEQQLSDLAIARQRDAHAPERPARLEVADRPCGDGEVLSGAIEVEESWRHALDGARRDRRLAWPPRLAAEPFRGGGERERRHHYSSALASRSRRTRSTSRGSNNRVPRGVVAAVGKRPARASLRTSSLEQSHARATSVVVK